MNFNIKTFCFPFNTTNKGKNKIKQVKKTIQRPLIFTLLITLFSFSVFAQDPLLPPTNLGLANVYDGIAGKPGFVYVGYLQIFNAKGNYGSEGQRLPSDLKVNSLLSMNQLIYLSKIKLLGGNLGFTTLIPIVKISANSQAAAPSVNPSLFGDPVVGSAVQWSDKKLFGKPFSHRIEFDLSIPVGAYSQQYNINPSSRMFSYGVYHAMTLLLNDRFSFSTRNQLNFNGKILDQQSRAGAFYNGNYSIDYTINKSLKIETAAYYLAQITGDSYDGDKSYYANNFNLSSTKEQVIGLGGGLIYFAGNGVLFEAKMFVETAAQNRSKGNRPTLRIAIPLN